MARPRKPIQKIEIHNEVLVKIDARAAEKGISREDLICHLLTKDERISDFTMITLLDFAYKFSTCCDELVSLLSKKPVIKALSEYTLIEVDGYIDQILQSDTTDF